ncbi:IclR family transcriptional regulator [Rothia sp. AR01]|uniref:IclR family transcriptional regulator n=1 Tax=Rothia santali TaxID=2949643 RepID=A0A9X2HFE0_9MICC|nr:IclR family transcriptional regulator [Rothia santali]MCP3424711.1 IclR family transcriptional regulator [Rothia santali]
MNRSALRASMLLIAAGDHPGGATAAELAAETGIPRPTAFRLLLSLVHTGLLVREGGSFALGWRIAQLGRAADPYRGLLPRIQAILDRLAADVNESVEYTVFDGLGSQETIAQSASARLLAPSQQYVGRSFPLHASATGKLLLAELGDEDVRALVPDRLEAFTPQTIVDRAELLSELDGVRARGFVTLDNELEEGLFVVAVPVRDGAGTALGGLAASGLDQRMKSTGVRVYVEKLEAASREIARSITGS